MKIAKPEVMNQTMNVIYSLDFINLILFISLNTQHENLIVVEMKK